MSEIGLKWCIHWACCNQHYGANLQRIFAMHCFHSELLCVLTGAIERGRKSCFSLIASEKILQNLFDRALGWTIASASNLTQCKFAADLKIYNFSWKFATGPIGGQWPKILEGPNQRRLLKIFLKISKISKIFKFLK